MLNAQDSQARQRYISYYLYNFEYSNAIAIIAVVKSLRERASRNFEEFFCTYATLLLPRTRASNGTIK